MLRRHRVELASLAVGTLLLLGFHSLVQLSMQQGQTRRVEASRQAAAWSECNRMPQRDRREACRAQLQPADHASTSRERPR